MIPFVASWRFGLCSAVTTIAINVFGWFPGPLNSPGGKIRWGWVRAFHWRVSMSRSLLRWEERSITTSGFFTGNSYANGSRRCIFYKNFPQVFYNDTSHFLRESFRSLKNPPFCISSEKLKKLIFTIRSTMEIFSLAVFCDAEWSLLNYANS